MAAYINDM